MKNYVYVMIRKDLPMPQKVVQSSHAVWELAKKHNLDNHPSVVILEMKDEKHLLKESQKITQKGLEGTSFREPLFNNETTAVAFLASSPQERLLFKYYQLLKERPVTQSCSHSKTKLELIETMAYEYSPARVCTKCHQVVSRNLTDQEKKQSIKFFYKTILESNISDEEIEKRKNGFNL